MDIDRRKATPMCGPQILPSRADLSTLIFNKARIAMAGTLLIGLCITSSFSAWGKEAKPQLPKSPQTWTEVQADKSPLIPEELVQFSTEFPEKDWWKQFRDNQLNQYIDRAVEANAHLSVARERMAEAKAYARIVFADELPKLNIRGDYFAIRRPQLPTAYLQPFNTPLKAEQLGAPGRSFDLYHTALQARYELDLFGLNRTQTRSAKLAHEAAHQQYRAHMLALMSEVAACYFNLLKVDRMLELQSGIVANQEEGLALQRMLFDEGLTVQDSVLALQQAVSQARRDRLELERMQDVLVHQMCILLGEPPVSSEQFQRGKLTELPLDSASLPSGTPSQLLQRRPDILAQELLLQQAKLDVSAARRMFFPSIQLIAQPGYLNTALKELIHPNNLYTLAGPMISQSLFSGGKKLANLNMEKSRYKQQFHQYREGILEAFQEVEDALVNLKSNKQQYEESLQDTHTALQQLDLTQARFSDGTNSRLDVLESTVRLATYQQGEAQYKSNLLVDMVSLFKAVGGGF